MNDDLAHIEASLSVREIDCPSCGGSLEIIAAGFTTSIICQYCGSGLDLVDEQVQLVVEHQEAAEALEIPLGTRGVLKGVEWAAIGYLQRADSWSLWEEYLLFNPYYGYRWLTRSPAGWSFGTPLMKLPDGASNPSFNFNGQRFKTFNANMKIRTEYVLGEFYWRAKKGDQAVGHDYVVAGQMLSKERSSDEISWTLGEWVSFAAMHDAFGTANEAEWPKTGHPPLPHQPSPFSGHFINLAIAAVLTAAAGLIAGVMLGQPNNHKSATINISYDQPATDKTLGPFEIKNTGQAFTIETRGDVASNSYVDFEFKLVEQATGKEIAAPTALEYYSGRDSDGNWVERVDRSVLKLSNVPKGLYDLEIEASPAPNIKSASTDYSMQITAHTGGFFLSNYMLFVLLLFAPVLWMGFRHLSFHQHRHSESDAADDDD